MVGMIPDRVPGSPVSSPVEQDKAKPLYNFTALQFEELMENDGIEKTTRAVVRGSNDQMSNTYLTYESLKDGTAVLLDKLPKYEGIKPEDRQLSDEAILNLFTNVEDYGRFDGGDGGGWTAFGTQLARTAPEAVGAAYGAEKGYKAGKVAAGFVPGNNIYGLLAKGIIISGSTLGLAIAGSIAAEEAEKAVIGEQGPITPSLQGAANAGETLAIGLSMITSPWTWAVNKTKMAGSGAIEFLENFKNVASGKFNYRGAMEATAKNAGISEGSYKSALAAREAAKKGAMFGSGSGVDVLGLFRFNPSGNILDPVKGPAVARVLGGIEKGFSQSLGRSTPEEIAKAAASGKIGAKYAADRPLRFVTIESGAAAGAALLANTAQSIDPYDEDTRFALELAGAALVPLPTQLLIERGPDAARTVISKMITWAKGDKTAEGILKSRSEQEAGKRIIQAIEESEEYEGPEQLEALIDSLMKQAVDKDGNPVPGTVKDLATATGMPLNGTLRGIQEQLESASDQLAMATESGRKQMLLRSESAIYDLIATGDPAAFAMAARMEQAIFEQNIVDNMELRVSRFYEAAKRVYGDRSPEGGSQQIELSERLDGILQTQIAASKAKESELWAQTKTYKIDQFKAANGKITAVPNLLRLLDKPDKKGGLKQPSLAGEEILNQKDSLGVLQEDINLIRAYFQPEEGVARGSNPYNSARIYQMRSVALENAANAKRNGNLIAQGQMLKVAEALEKDLLGVDGTVDAAYNTARAYTYARNNVYTRTFLGDLQQSTKNRGVKVPPEEVAAKLLSGTSVATSKRIRDINNMAAFAIEHNLSDAAINNATTLDSIDLVIRDSLRQIVKETPAINPVTKAPFLDEAGEPVVEYVINSKALENFKKRAGTKELFAVFPQLEKDLANAESAKNLLNASNKVLTNLGKSPEVLAFQSVIKYADKPSKVVSNAINGDTPEKSLLELVRLATKNPKIYDEEMGLELPGDMALKGLRNSIMDYALFKAGGTGKLNADTLADTLFAQVPGVTTTRKFTLMDFMKEHKMITEKETKQLQSLIKEFRGVEEAFNTGNLENVLFKNPSFAKLFYTKAIGATLGVKGQQTLNDALKKIGLGADGNVLGGGMIAAQTGSQIIQQLILRGPESMTVKTMSTLFAHPELMGPLLRKIKNKKDGDEALEAMATGFAGISRQVGRRLPYAIRYSQDQDFDEDLEVADIEQDLPLRRPQRSPNPPANSTPMEPPSGPAPSLRQPVSAAPQRPPVESVAPQRQAATQSGPVDRARFAALFPEDRELMGIGSLMENV